MLDGSSVVAFVPTSDLAAAREFYGTILGLPIVEESPFALVVDGNGTSIRITPVPDLHPQPFTILGWQVDDIRTTVARLGARGVEFHRYEGMEQTDEGIWQSPGGAQVAWFGDPDGNTLSLTELAGVPVR